MIPLPPEELSRIDGGSDPDVFLNYGSELYRQFRTRRLFPNDGFVLDIGCGVGREARHFHDDPRFVGTYCGIEIDARDVAWCWENIKSRGGATFQFLHADLFNEHYNPGGRRSAEWFRIPSDDKAADFVFLLSVFTHMKPGAIKHYLSEIARVLKPNCFCYATAFLTDDPNAITDNEMKSVYLADDFTAWTLAAGFEVAERFKLGRQDQLVLKRAA